MEAIALDVPKWEVCRLFSAMLQLVNAGSIGIQRCQDLSQPFLIHLQHMNLPHQSLANFRAASLLQEKVGHGPLPHC